MIKENGFERRLNELQQEVHGLTDDFTAEHVEETALQLERLNFAPPIITDLRVFLRLRRLDLFREIDRIIAMPEAEVCALADGDQRKCEDLRLQYITVLIFYYKKLLALRAGDPGEWDEIDELYVHD